MNPKLLAAARSLKARNLELNNLQSQLEQAQVALDKAHKEFRVAVMEAGIVNAGGIHNINLASVLIGE